METQTILADLPCNTKPHPEGYGNTESVKYLKTLYVYPEGVYDPSLRYMIHCSSCNKKLYLQTILHGRQTFCKHCYEAHEKYRIDLEFIVYDEKTGIAVRYILKENGRFDEMEKQDIEYKWTENGWIERE